MKFEYGCWITVGNDKKVVIVRVPQEEFALALGVAYMETKNLSEAIEIVKAQVVRELRYA